MSAYNRARSKLTTARNGLIAQRDVARDRGHRAALAHMISGVEGLIDYCDANMTKPEGVDVQCEAHEHHERMRTEFERWAKARCMSVERRDEPQHGLEGYAMPELTTAWHAVLAMVAAAKK